MVALATLSGAAVSTARPPTASVTLEPGDFQPLVLRGAASPTGTPWPSFELAAQASPVPIGDFQEPEREFGPRVTPNQPTRAGAVIKAPPRPKHARQGTASWYCRVGVSACHHRYASGLYAAAGPGLRVGNWRGRTVRVCAGDRCVRVKLIDWCQCHSSRVIDLYSDAYRRLAPLSSGTTRVTVAW